MPASENQLQRELNIAWSVEGVHLRDLAEISRLGRHAGGVESGDRVVELSEHGCVADIETFGPELELHRLPDREVLEDRQIDPHISGDIERIVAQVALRAERLPPE